MSDDPLPIFRACFDALARRLDAIEQGVVADLATKADLRTAIAELKADLHKAIALQSFVLLAAMFGLKLFG